MGKIFIGLTHEYSIFLNEANSNLITSISTYFKLCSPEAVALRERVERFLLNSGYLVSGAILFWLIEIIVAPKSSLPSSDKARVSVAAGTIAPAPIIEDGLDISLGQWG